MRARPGSRVRGTLDRLHIWQKLLLLGVVFALLFAVPTTLFLRQVAQALAQSQREMQATDAANGMMALVRALGEHRSLAAAGAGSADVSADQEAARKRVDAGFAALANEVANARADGPLIAAVEGWKALAAAAGATKLLSASDSNSSHNEVIANVLATMEAMIDAAGLTSDSEPAIQRSARIAFLHVPMLVEAVGKAAAKGMGYLGAKQAAPEDRVALTADLVKVKERQAELRAAVNKAMGSSVDLQEILAPAQLAADAGVDQALKLTRVEVVFSQDLAARPLEHHANHVKALEPQFKLASVAAAEARKLLAARAARERLEIMIFVVVALAVFALAVGFAVWTARSITRPLGHAVLVADGIAAGHLDHDIDEGRAKNAEAAKLLGAFRSMQSGLSELMGEVQSAAQEIQHASVQVAEGNADLSSRTEHQASSLEETAATMEELSTTVKSNAENARKASAVVAEASESAMKGSEAVATAVATMHTINEKSRHVADIISVIDGIAFQTNILALNAAVEAARAGEQGRGFAVVAAEVRSLAQRSAQAAKEIKALIAEAVEATNKGTKSVDASGRAMDDIMDSVQRVAAIFNEIATASSEQRHGIEQVEKAVTEMDRATQENAALVGEVASSSQSLEQQAQRLAELISRFHLGGEREAERGEREAAAEAAPMAAPHPSYPTVSTRKSVPRLTAAE